MYYHLRPDLWTISFNYEAIGSVTTSEDLKEMKVVGEFRTTGDYMGLSFTSLDFWSHEYTKYSTSYDYSDSIMKFNVVKNGIVSDFNDTSTVPSLIIRKTDESENYVTLGFSGVKHEGYSLTIFDKQQNLDHEWIDVGSEKVGWRTDESGPYNYNSRLGDDYDIDYVRGVLFTKEGIIPSNADVIVEYTYNTHETYTIDFSNISQGVHPDEYFKISVNNVDKITFPIIPENYTEGELVMTGKTDLFEVVFSDILITGGELNNEPPSLQEHAYRVAEGYDDEYNKNPSRIVDMMHALGYRKVINYYIGASHFYQKWGDENVVSTSVHDMVLDGNVGINSAFRAWSYSLFTSMKKKGFEEIIISVAMENLQMPEEWKQRMWDGVPGQSGWDPPTSFYSPTNADLKVYIERITKECIELAISSGLKVSLQLGESWWWWQEFAPGDVDQPYDGRPPCFYDSATTERFESEMGYPMPVYKNSIIDTVEENWIVANKLQQYLGEYTLFMKGIAETYESVRFTTLFFPPSVLDVDRVPELLRYINYPKSYWQYPILDYIQIEDYDWVTTKNENHNSVYALPFIDMGYSFNKQHYFSGFVLKPENAATEWPLIERAAQEALGRRYQEVFIWAGTQIRRDSWDPMRNVIRTDSTTLNRVTFKN